MFHSTASANGSAKASSTWTSAGTDVKTDTIITLDVPQVKNIGLKVEACHDEYFQLRVVVIVVVVVVWRTCRCLGFGGKKVPRSCSVCVCRGAIQWTGMLANVRIVVHSEAPLYLTFAHLGRQSSFNADAAYGNLNLSLHGFGADARKIVSFIEVLEAIDAKLKKSVSDLHEYLLQHQLIHARFTRHDYFPLVRKAKTLTQHDRVCARLELKSIGLQDKDTGTRIPADGSNDLRKFMAHPHLELTKMWAFPDRDDANHLIYYPRLDVLADAEHTVFVTQDKSLGSANDDPTSFSRPATTTPLPAELQFRSF
jgi:hypothetical protein